MQVAADQEQGIIATAVLPNDQNQLHIRRQLRLISKPPDLNERCSATAFGDRKCLQWQQEQTVDPLTGQQLPVHRVIVREAEPREDPG